MLDGKTETLTVCVKPALEAALRTAATRDHHSLTNMVEVMIRDDGTRERIEIDKPAPDDPEAPTPKAKPTRTS